MNHDKIKTINEVAKTVFTAVFAVFVFYAIEKPGSILNREKTEEEIRRDRAKLLVEISAIDDQIQQSNALAAVRYAYRGHDDAFFQGVEQLISVSRDTRDLQREAAQEDLTVVQCQNLQRRVAALREELVEKSQLASEEEKTGRGPVFFEIQSSIRQLGAELSVIEETVAQKC